MIEKAPPPHLFNQAGRPDADVQYVIGPHILPHTFSTSRAGLTPMFSTSVVHTSFPPWKPMRTWRGTAVQQGEVDKLSGPSLSWRGTAAQGAVQWTCHPPPSPGRVHCLTPHHTSPHYRTPSHTECATPHVRTGLNTVEMHDCISLSVRMFSCEGKTGCGGSGVGRGVYTVTVPSCP